MDASMLHEDAKALHSMFPCWTLVRLSELLRDNRGNVKRTVKAIAACDGARAGDDLSVAVVGGGIGGLALALALQHHGISCRVFERDSHFDQRRQGYGLTMQQATSALRSLGFEMSAGDNVGVHSTRHVVLTSSGRQVGEWGQRKWGRGADKATRSNFHIPRQALRRLLLDALRPGTVAWGHRFSRLVEGEPSPRPRAVTLSPSLDSSAKLPAAEEDLGLGRPIARGALVSPVADRAPEPRGQGASPPDFDLLPELDARATAEAPAGRRRGGVGERPTGFRRQAVEFLNGSGETVRHAAHVIVGCDGINGCVRRQLVGEDACPLQYLGVIVVLGIAGNLPEGSEGAEVADGRSAFQMSDSSTRLFGMPFDGARTMWQLSFPMELDAATALSRTGAEALKAEALRVCEGWAPPIPQLLRSTSLDDISGYPVWDRPLLGRECFGGRDDAGVAVTLLGDAAHPMSPFKGQGANQALVDAVSLAKELSQCRQEEGLLPALRRYEAEMMERSAKKVLASREAVAFLHSELAVSEGDKTRAGIAKEARQRAAREAEATRKGKGRTLLASGARGKVLEWRGSFGWLQLDEQVDHPAAALNDGRVYLNSQDLQDAALEAGQPCSFDLLADAKGFCAENCAGDH